MKRILWEIIKEEKRLNSEGNFVKYIKIYLTLKLFQSFS